MLRKLMVLMLVVAIPMATGAKKKKKKKKKKRKQTAAAVTNDTEMQAFREKHENLARQYSTLKAEVDRLRAAQESRQATSQINEPALPKARKTGVGGHIGMVHGMYSKSGDVSSNVTDRFAPGFPMGITVKPWKYAAFDLEFIAAITDEPRTTPLTVHPGLIVPVAGGLAVGLRAAFEVNQSVWGFTPLINYGIPVFDGTKVFLEVPFPVRFAESVATYTVALHVGVGF